MKKIQQNLTDFHFDQKDKTLGEPPLKVKMGSNFIGNTLSRCEWIQVEPYVFRYANTVGLVFISDRRLIVVSRKVVKIYLFSRTK